MRARSFCVAVVVMLIGIATLDASPRFDFAQASDAPNEFVLVEVYRDAAAPDAHKQTVHYQTWRDTVADMMASPRTSRRFAALYPDPARWFTPAAP